mgnify:CR=1 FL=1
MKFKTNLINGKIFSQENNKAHTLLTEALQALEAIPYNTVLLEEFARYVIERKN